MPKQLLLAKHEGGKLGNSDPVKTIERLFSTSRAIQYIQFKIM